MLVAFQILGAWWIISRHIMTKADDDKLEGSVVTAEAAEKKNEPTDYELAQRAAGGDGDAFEQLYRRHFRRVFALTLRMMGDPVRAEDMTQEVFVQIFNKVGSFRGESAFTTWLHRMTVNLVLMYFRKASTR